LFFVCTATAQADNVLKPYVVLMLDTSGSMDARNPTNSGPPTCGGTDTRLNHARCAINRIVNSYGDMVFALGRFRMSSSTDGTFSTCDSDGDTRGAEGDDCFSVGVGCSLGDAGGEMLTGLVDGGNQSAATWTDFSCGTCGGQGTALSAQPEIWGAEGSTPLGGYLTSASLYWRGLQASDGGNTYTIWAPNRCVGGTAAGTPCVDATPCTGGGSCSGANPGFDPIRSDTTKNQFLPTGCDPSATCDDSIIGNNCCTSQCRSYITIMLTDGDENCGGNAETVAQSMLKLNVDNQRYRVETKVIGFGVNPGDTDIERYAHAGGAVDVPGKFEGYYVNDEASLQLALAQILADAVKVETCNNKDDDCDGNTDEDFLPPKSIPGKGGTCDNGQLGACHRDGSLQCRADGAGLECNAPSVTPGSRPRRSVSRVVSAARPRRSPSAWVRRAGRARIWAWSSSRRRAATVSTTTATRTPTRTRRTCTRRATTAARASARAPARSSATRRASRRATAPRCATSPRRVRRRTRARRATTKITIATARRTKARRPVVCSARSGSISAAVARS
jgi:hypothetical protein